MTWMLFFIGLMCCGSTTRPEISWPLGAVLMIAATALHVWVLGVTP